MTSLFISAVLLTSFRMTSCVSPAENTKEFWYSNGLQGIEASVDRFAQLNPTRAKNVVMMIGDGMNIATLTAGRIAIGQKSGASGEEHVTAIDQLPHTGIAKTYSVDYQTPDSAATATAFLTGVKTNQGTLGVRAGARNCDTDAVTSALEHAISQGKSTGIVTTTRVQQATPGAGYAHSLQRSAYTDRLLTINGRGCKDIAMQLYEKRRQIQVILGGGRSHMRPSSVLDEEGLGNRGDRGDNRDLIQMWRNDMERMNGSYVWNKRAFDQVNPLTTDYLLGLFSPLDMEFIINKPRNQRYDEPTLEEMTRKAIQILSKNPNGFFLLVEGGMIDKGHHHGRAKFALEEFHEFDKAVAAVKSMTSEQDTLLIVTADHGHMFTFGGGAVRGNSVYGLAKNNSRPDRALDGRPFTSILYGNGPGYSMYKGQRRYPGPWVANSKFYKAQSAVPLRAETHSAEDVTVYASGPWSHFISGVHEQSYLAHVMLYSACLGPLYTTYPHCATTPNTIQPIPNPGRVKHDEPPTPNASTEQEKR
ncbi:alkaline phosphatase [Ciona intestinalis]